MGKKRYNNSGFFGFGGENQWVILLLLIIVIVGLGDEGFGGFGF